MVPPPRNRYADLLRVLAIGMVVLGHWLLTSISYSGGRLSGIDAMSDIGWSGLGTLVFQVMPVFFVVGGYANGTLAAYGCGVILTLAAGRLAPRMTVAERPV